MLAEDKPVFVGSWMSIPSGRNLENASEPFVGVAFPLRFTDPPPSVRLVFVSDHWKVRRIKSYLTPMWSDPDTAGQRTAGSDCLNSSLQGVCDPPPNPDLHPAGLLVP